MADIYGKIHNVQKSIKGLEKNGVGPSTQGSYKFLAVDDILVAVKPLLDEEGVIVIPTLVDQGFHYNTAAVKDDGRVARESVQAFVKYEFKFVAVSDASSVSTVVIGEGIDTQDKAIRKATTSAWKIALIQTFALITGEVDPDGQDGAHAAQETAPASGGNRALRTANNAPSQPGIDPEVADLQKKVAATAAEKDVKHREIGAEMFAGDATWATNPAKLQQLLTAIEAK